jgi:hypothetical protein
MDVLSEVLRVVRVSGAVHLLGEFTHPWAFESSAPDELPARLRPGAESISLSRSRLWPLLGDLWQPAPCADRSR